MASEKLYRNTLSKLPLLMRSNTLTSLQYNITSVAILQVLPQTKITKKEKLNH